MTAPFHLLRPLSPIYYSRSYLLRSLLFTAVALIYCDRFYPLRPLLFTAAALIYCDRFYPLRPLLSAAVASAYTAAPSIMAASVYRGRSHLL